MWTRPEWEIYGPSGKTLLGRGRSLEEAKEDIKRRLDEQWYYMQGMSTYWTDRSLRPSDFGSGLTLRGYLWR